MDAFMIMCGAGPDARWWRSQVASGYQNVGEGRVRACCCSLADTCWHSAGAGDRRASASYGEHNCRTQLVVTQAGLLY